MFLHRMRRMKYRGLVSDDVTLLAQREQMALQSEWLLSPQVLLTCELQTHGRVIRDSTNKRTPTNNNNNKKKNLVDVANDMEQFLSEGGLREALGLGCGYSLEGRLVVGVEGGQGLTQVHSALHLRELGLIVCPSF